MTIRCSHSIAGNRVYSFQYNPYEIAIVAQSPDQRGRLAALVAALFTNDFLVGNVIHRNPEGGADSSPLGVTLIHGDGQNGLLYPQQLDDYLRPRPLIDVDLVFVEAGGNTQLSKLIWVEDGKPPQFENVLAYVGPQEACPVLPAEVPYFAVGQGLLLKQFLMDYLRGLAATVPLYGLVLTGGMSTRMNMDKGALAYHGRSQVGHCYDLLKSFCDSVFVSLRAEQAQAQVYRGFPQIHDRFLGFGPMGGILSAQKEHPEAAWLVLACDLPYVTPEVLNNLVLQRDPFKLATAYVSANDGFPEPLCAIYEPKSVFRLMQFLALGYHCPRKVLINSNPCLLELGDRHALDNVNTPAEREGALRYFSAGAAQQ